MRVVFVVGSRRAEAFAPASAFGRRCARSGWAGVVGCASGADAGFRAGLAAGGSRAAVFSRAVLFPRLPFRAGLAARSVLLVRSAALLAAPVVGFCLSPCPASVRPGRRWVAARSGSWSALALAAGLGCSVFVSWVGSGPPALPSWWGGSWVLVRAGVWRFLPGELSLPLF